MKIVLNPEYKFLQQFVQDLPTRFASEGKVIQDKRNTIKVFEYKELEINVKRYRVPIFINRIAYRFFRKSKAVKAYFNSLEVRKRGFNTPESIDCIETFRGGLLHYSYYISLQCPFHKEMRELYFGPLTGNEDLLRAFARYTAALHEAGICHQDYSPGNVLVNGEGDCFQFALIDINRMKFRQMDLKKGCKNLMRMFENEEIYTFIAQEYARSRHFDPQQCKAWIHYYNHLSLKRDYRKKKFKAFKKRFF